ncbi:MAG: SdrD B-like domain-containing protein, partial [Cumulibacter sp.]
MFEPLASRAVRSRRPWAFALLGLIAAATMVPAGSAEADDGDFAFGSVYADANKDGVRDIQWDQAIPGVEAVLFDADGTELATTTSDVNGRWAFRTSDLPETALNDPLAQYTVQLDTGAGGYFAGHTEIGSDNRFIRDVDEPNLLTSEPFLYVVGSGTEVNAMVIPVWQMDTALVNDPAGWNGNAVYTGVAEFDPSDDEPGWDSSVSNDIVRSGDTVKYLWNVTLAADEAMAAMVKNVVFEQTLELHNGSKVSFDSIPAKCQAAGEPESRIVAYPSEKVLSPRETPPDGTTSVTLYCNLGEMGDSLTAQTLPVTAWVSSDSPNGSSFTSTARTYGLDAETGSYVTARPDNGIENGPLKITSLSRYDLMKTVYTSGAGTSIVDGETVRGRIVYYNVAITTDQTKGRQALEDPITITEDFWAEYLPGS